MAFFEIHNVRIVGVAAGVPKRKINNLQKDIKGVFSQDYSQEDFVEATGVLERRITYTLTTSDLCFEASNRLISDMNWDRKDIDALIFVSQSRDYATPATSGILQDKLGLKTSTFCLDLTLGCSGWVYGLNTISALMQNGGIRKALLMVGDSKSIPEIETPPLFGHAGTVTALEYEEGCVGLKFHLGTDGSGYDAIITPDGGMRNWVTPRSYEMRQCEDGYKNRLQSQMKGMDVFAFGITVVPKTIKKISEYYSFDYQNIDYLILHQANKSMLDMIVRKLKLPQEKVPYSLCRYGNTSSASIPLTIVTELKGKVENKETKFICCGFGVGLSWGTVSFSTKSLVISDLVEVEEN